MRTLLSAFGSPILIDFVSSCIAQSRQASSHLQSATYVEFLEGLRQQAVQVASGAEEVGAAAGGPGGSLRRRVRGGEGRRYAAAVQVPSRAEEVGAAGGGRLRVLNSLGVQWPRGQADSELSLATFGVSPDGVLVTPPTGCSKLCEYRVSGSFKDHRILVILSFHIVTHSLDSIPHSLATPRRPLLDTAGYQNGRKEQKHEQNGAPLPSWVSFHVASSMLWIRASANRGNGRRWWTTRLWASAWSCGRPAVGQGT